MPEIPYMGKYPWGKTLCFEWKIAIRSKTFAVAVLLSYIADQQGPISWKRFAVE